MIALYDSTTIDTLEWPATNEGEAAKKFLLPLVKKGISHYVDNIQAQIYALKVDNLVLSVIDANEKKHNSYVCSPYDFYISFGKQSLHIIENPLLAKAVGTLVSILGVIGRYGQMNSVIYVNNGLFSTDLYPKELSKDVIKSIISFLKKRFPHRAILFRSLNPVIYGTLTQELRELGCHLVASRQVHLTDTTQDHLFDTRIIKSDLRLFNKSSYSIVDEKELGIKDGEKLHSLYHFLYIKQHSPLSPQFNVRFVELLLEQKLLQFKVIKNENIIMGVAGYYERSGVMICPFFGFDKSHPDHAVIYRLLSTALLLEARERKLVFHQSAGASFYKKVRRAQSCIETMAIYIDHLPLKQKIAWSILKGVINKVGPKYMERY